MAGHDNWITTNLRDRKRDPRIDFQITFNPQPFHAMSFDAAADLNAQRIAARSNNIWLALSGGMDSEFVANVFLRNSIPFTPIIFSDTIYPDESHNAIHWCKLNGIKPFMISDTFDNTRFSEKLTQICRSLNLISVNGALQIYFSHIVNKEGGQLVTGLGDPFDVDHPVYPDVMTTKIEIPEWDFYIDELTTGNVGAFYSYSPELMHAMVRDMDYSLSLQEAKSKIYGIHFRTKIRNYSKTISSVYDLMSEKLGEDYFRMGSKDEVLASFPIIP
jgi:hypothetical protein